MKKTHLYIMLFAMFLLLPVLACGGSDNTTPTEAPAATAPPAQATTAPAATTAAATTAPTTSGAVSTLEDVRKAVIQIVARGTFMDPEVGLQLNAAGAGSGFIIDPSGIAVTNNHVVTGAATLEVYLEGQDEARNARVLAVSECSDLAVIDIDGDGFPYLEWYSGPISVGLDVYAAGFPLGDPEFTLTRGIISKEDADGDTSWASVDQVLEHDATINPGNSGGPLVTADGKVVGVNYAGAAGVDQYFAINEAEALRHIDILRNGEDVTSVGINGTAVSDGESIFGIWVSSVESGSPADAAGIEAGDIITSLEGLVLSTDGTMADYCDVLRSRSADDVMDVEVLRFATGEVLEGQLNGRELETTFSFGQELAEETADEPATGETGGTATYDSYMTITDDSGVLTVDVPTAWADTNGGAWLDVDDNEIGPAVSAAPNLDEFNTTWSTPGMFFSATNQLDHTIESLLDNFDFSTDCTYDGRFDYEDPLYTGKYDQWSACGGTQNLFIVLVVEPEDASFLAMVQVQVISDADLDALDTIMNTFIVNQ